MRMACRSLDESITSSNVPMKLLAFPPCQNSLGKRNLHRSWEPPSFAWFGQTICSRKTTGLRQPLEGGVQDSAEPAWVRMGLGCCLEKARQQQHCSPRESPTAGSSTADCHRHRHPPALALGANSTQ